MKLVSHTAIYERMDPGNRLLEINHKRVIVSLSHVPTREFEQAHFISSALSDENVEAACADGIHVLIINSS